RIALGEGPSACAPNKISHGAFAPGDRAGGPPMRLSGAGGSDMARTIRLRVAAAAAFALAAAALPAQAQEPTSIRIGWAISKTGPYVGGATITLLNAYKLWVKDVNAAGGIMLKSINKKLPIEVIEYDDRSNSDEMIKAVERLINQDKVDFVLP